MPGAANRCRNSDTISRKKASLVTVVTLKELASPEFIKEWDEKGRWLRTNAEANHLGSPSETWI